MRGCSLVLLVGVTSSGTSTEAFQLLKQSPSPSPAATVTPVTSSPEQTELSIVTDANGEPPEVEVEEIAQGDADQYLTNLKKGPEDERSKKQREEDIEKKVDEKLNGIRHRLSRY